MATIFSHPFVPLAIRAGFGRAAISNRLLFVAAVATILPDIDVLAFRFGIPYSSDFGHRGITHSLAFALLVGFAAMPFSRYMETTRLKAFLFIGFSCASHGFLDAMTNGGLGIAFFWPFSSERFFLPWRPLEVSPIGAVNFFAQGGQEVLFSEFIWLFLPLAFIALFVFLMKNRPKRKTR